MVEIVRGEAKDYNNIISLADEVFRFNEENSFVKILPKIYKDKPHYAKEHLLLKESGELKSLLIIHKEKIKVLDNVLNVASIGTVSSHPSARGKGYMSMLLEKANEEMEKDNLDFAFLDGDRQRYENYGFVPSGIHLDTYYNDFNLEHLMKNKTRKNIEIKLLEGDKALISEVYSIYKNLPVTNLLRTEDTFFEVACSYAAVPAAILIDGKLEGYIIYQKEKNKLTVTELYLNDWKDVTDVALLMVEKEECRGITIQVPYWYPELVTIACEGAAVFKVCSNHSYSIFNFKNTIEAFLKLKNKYLPLSNGEVSFAIEKEIFKIKIKDGDILVSNLDVAPSNAVRLNKKEATLQLFSVQGLMLNLFKEGEIPSDWFPLYLKIAVPDSA